MKYLSGVLLVFAFCFSQAQEREFSRPDLPGDLLVDLGINSWSSYPEGLERRAFASKSVSIYYVKRRELSNKFSLYYGMGLGLEKIAFQSDSTLLYDGTLSVDEMPFINVDKNKLAITYLDIPFEFRFHPKGTEDGEGLFVGVGGIVGLKLNAHTKWRYDDGGGNSVIKIQDDFDIESLRYGYQVRLGFKGVHLFFKDYLSDTFANEIEGANPALRTIGINLTGF